MQKSYSIFTSNLLKDLLADPFCLSPIQQEVPCQERLLKMAEVRAEQKAILKFSQEFRAVLWIPRQSI